MKSCRMCGQDKPLTQFGRLAVAPDGLNYLCKSCNSKRGLDRYYAKREQILAGARHRRAAQHEHVVQIERASRERNREKWRPAKNARQSARNRVLAEKTYLILEKELRRLYEQPCAACGSTSRQSVDHVIPLSRGGRHSIGNLMTLCTPCNASKHARLLIEWRRSKTLLAA